LVDFYKSSPLSALPNEPKLGRKHLDEISNLYRGLPIDDTYQVSVHLAKRFQRRRFFRFLKFFSSEIVLPKEPKLGRKHL
jgi:hypothetical protein